MKRVVLILLLIFLAVPGKANAATGTTQVTGSVGDFYLNLAGFVSPFASVVLSSNSAFMRSTVANNKGDFSFSQVLVKKGFSGFCLTAVDVRRIGDSYTCFKIPPVQATYTRKNIFLPPTLGLSRAQISTRESADAFGYTMPHARVHLYISSGRLLEATADSQGFYLIKVNNLPPGDYNLYSTATFEGRQSETPSKTVQLKSLSWWQLLLGFLWKLLLRIITGLFHLLLTYIWIVLPGLILLIILVLKPVRDKITQLHHSIFVGEKKDHKGLHHAWFIGY